MMDKPTFITDPTYKQWVNDIERRFRSQQIKAVVQVNSCKIEFYWSIGRDICEMNVEQRYGDGVIKTLSQDLRMKIPEVKGLTPGGLYYCKRFYLLYNKVFEIFPQLGEKSVPQLGEILTPLHSVSTDTNIQPLNIFAIPWGHHKVLIDNFESEPQKALFYAAKTLQNGWSRAVLENMIGDKGKNNGLYERQGNAVNNFPATLMPPTGDLAKELINDPINLSFVKLKEKLSEDNLKQAMVRHVNELLLALGSGFAYPPSMKMSLTNSSTPPIPAPQTQHTDTQLLNSVILGNLSSIHLLLAPTSVPLFLLLALLCIPLFCHPPSLYFLKNHDHIIYFPYLSLKFKANQKALVKVVDGANVVTGFVPSHEG